MPPSLAAQEEAVRFMIIDEKTTFVEEPHKPGDEPSYFRKIIRSRRFASEYMNLMRNYVSSSLM